MIRLYLACGLFSCWMILLFTGWVLGGLTHLLLAAAVVLFFAPDQSKPGRSGSDQAGPR